MVDIIDHFDDETGEEALGMQIKDVTTLSIRKARSLQRRFNNNLKAENNVLDSINYPRADLSSISSHATAAKRLMRSMNNIDDEVLRKLIKKASRAHCNVVEYLSQEKSQKGNVEMITPAKTPGPSTSPRSRQQHSKSNPTKTITRKLASARGNTRRVGMPPKGKGSARRMVNIVGPLKTNDEENIG